MRHADLSLTVSQRKLACVLDPALVLGHAHGPTLALRLTRVFEAWLTRSFWQVIDASELLLLRGGPYLAARNAADCLTQPDPQALATWVAMRGQTDAGSWTLRWMGDCLAESQVHDGADPDVVEHYETLAAALAERMLKGEPHRSTWADGLDPVMGALDTVALSASLQGALVLSQISNDAPGTPWPVQALERAGLPVVPLDPMPADSLFAAERQWVRHALVTAGLAAVAERLPRLAVVHVMLRASGPNAKALVGDGVDPLADPWAHAHGWWYRV